MPITNEQIERFEDVVDFDAISELSERRIALRGKEAIVKRIVGQNGKVYAFKWYASLRDRPEHELIDYAHRVKEDERLYLSRKGIRKEQVPISHFFVASFESRSDLFSTQDWTDAKELRQHSSWELITNWPFLRNLAIIWMELRAIYPETGKLPDLTGGRRLRILGRDIVEPCTFFNPFLTTNIMRKGDLPIIIDAKTNNPVRSVLIGVLVRMNRLITIATAKAILLIDKVMPK